MAQPGDAEQIAPGSVDREAVLETVDAHGREIIKRAMDILLSIAALAIFGPLLAVSAVLIKLDSPGPVLFRQQRLGKNGRPFDILKLRTMAADAPELFRDDRSRLVLRDDPRVTRVGRFLRLGFDELPQLINVLKGEMSIVGPRPDDLYALDLYSEHEAQKLRMKPGITGLAEVQGRNRLTWRERVGYDVQYVENWSLCLDIRIMLSTWKIFLYH